MSVKSNQYINALDLESDSDSDSYEYQPPKHYKPVEVKHSKVAKKISKPNKSIYLIKYPKSMSIESLKKVSQTIKQDNKVYDVIRSDNTNDLNKYKVFINGNEKYLPTDKSIDQLLTIHESIKLPTYDIEKVKVARSDVPRVTGLKMRHFPTGYTAEDYNIGTDINDNNDTTKNTDMDDSQLEHKHKKPKKEKKEKKDKKDKKEKKEKN